MEYQGNLEDVYYNRQFLKVSFARLIRSMSTFDGFRFNSLTTAAHCSSVKGGIGSGSTFLTHPAFIQQYYGTCTVQYGTIKLLKGIMAQT